MLTLTWVLLVAAPSQPVTTQEVAVVLAPQVPELDVVSVKVIAVSEDGAEFAMPVSLAGGKVRFDLAVDRAWRVRCEGSQLWCPEIEVPAGGSGRRILLPVTKRALLKGGVRAAHPAELPVNLQFQGWGYLSDAPQPLSFHVSATVEEGRFELSVPAVLLDLRIAGEGFSPIYLWDVAAQGRAVLDLGSVTLKLGNSLCGFVHDGSSGLPLELAEVVLRFPLRPIGSPAKSNKRLRRMTWTTHTNERGFYQIVGPPDGNYQLEVKSADPEHQLLVVESVGILADAETCLEDLAVRRAIEVSFTISPPQDPDANPWQVKLSPSGSGGFVEPASAVQLDETGRAKFRVSPGIHDLSVFGAGTGLKVLRRSIELEVPTDIPLTLDLIRIEGSVQLGEEPLVARIHLWVHEADTMVESDYEGHFSGWIRAPPDLRLMAEISAAYPPFSRWLELDEITIEDGVLRLDLAFEDRALEGSVTDEKGTPIRLAEVTAVPVDSRMPINSKTEVDGSFRLTGLAEKPYLVWATADNFGTSEKVRVDPWGDGSGPQLTLALRRGRLIRGRLTSAELVPVPGARVMFLVPGRSASTDMDGRFEFRAPEGARRAVVQVRAASHVHWSACVELPHDETELSLRLPPLPGGRIILRVPRTERFGPTRQLVLMSSDGGLFTFTQLTNFVNPLARSNAAGGSPEEDWTFEFPHLASGLYTAIWTSMNAFDLAAQTCAGVFSAADWQYLTPGGELSLTAVSSGTRRGSGAGVESE